MKKRRHENAKKRGYVSWFRGPLLNGETLKRILLLATTTGYQTRSFTEAAATLGIDLVFATDRCDRIEDPWQDAAIPIRFHEEDRSVDAIVAAARDRAIDGILVVGDRPTVIAANAAAALGLAWHPADAAAIARHKLRTRERLRDAGMAVPWFQQVRVDNDPRLIAPTLSYPCVVKPLALSGSRGVIRADDPQSFVEAFERLRAILRSADVRQERMEAHGFVLIEGFVPGRELAVEGLLHHGRLHVLAVFDKPDPLDGPFFEETIYVTPSSVAAGLEGSIVTAVRRAATAIGLHHGPIHAECRVNADGVYVLEVAARPIGGLCARALRFRPRHESQDTNPARAATNPESRTPNPDVIPLEELLLRHALGEDPIAWRREADASGVMMIPIPRRGVFRGADDADAARAVPHVADVRITAKVDQVLVPLPEGASYLGFIFARAPMAADVDRALRAAHARLAFRIDPEVHIVGGQIHYNHAHG